MDHSEHNKVAEERIIDDVNNFGFHIGLIEADEADPSYGFTIGLWKNYKHPEIIVFGLPTQILASILNIAETKSKTGYQLD